MRSELNPNIETESKKEHLHNFFEMDKEQEGVLKEKIKKFNGLVRIFIHPDFEKYSNFQVKPDDIKKLKKAEQTFQKILSSQSEKVPPIFIFISSYDFDEYEETEERLKELISNDVYIIRTEFANSKPLSPAREKTYRHANISDEERSQMWQMVIDKFKELGITRILIGGLELYLSRNVKDPSHGGCLGTAINKLQKNFSAELSNLTWPEGRKEIKK